MSSTTKKYEELPVEKVREYKIPARLKERLLRSKKARQSFAASHIAHTDQGGSDHYDYYSDRG